MIRIAASGFLVIVISFVHADDKKWYTEGDFAPSKRLTVTVVNTLDVERLNCPVVITRDQFPVKKLHEMWVTVVDPSLPSKPEPTKEESAFAGGHGIRTETNGHQVFYQDVYSQLLRLLWRPEGEFRLWIRYHGCEQLVWRGGNRSV